MAEQIQQVQLFRGTMCHVEGALNNQRSFLRQHPDESIVCEPVNDSTIRALHEARKGGKYTVNAPLPDVIHAIEGMRRQAASLIVTSETDSCAMYAEIARIRGNGLRALANIMVNDAMSAYQLSPETQQELLVPLESAIRK